jgi:hypothetical protein
VSAAQSTVYVCLDETDEWHPVCPFATRSHEEMEEHEKIAGHWCEIDTTGMSESGMWAEVLRRKDEEADQRAA